LTLDEFQQLVPPFEAAFHVHMAAWRLDGKPQTASLPSLSTARGNYAASSAGCDIPNLASNLVFVYVH